ncbi:MAG TPA: bifunctional adenosylcobinamide kinase/adenosylcobinamide-phosphate guanylyltransferase [Deltaproteobacteria bacterium]|nr:bifunctional adenosylcobinamide kinase/adenosylcobinamide-phosphate guanylyltransferase [Deltaproteobacteria bacterium]
MKSSKFKVQSSKKDPQPSPRDSRLIFVTGGCRSGKSKYALKLAESMNGRKLYLATGEPFDEEMAERIKKHKKERGNNWTTIEEPINVIDAVKKNKRCDVILLDCLTLWISNLLMKDSRLKKIIVNLISTCKHSKANIIIVSNEVGLGIVPDNELARKFRDIIGLANQRIAAASDDVYFVVSGIPLKIK